MNKRIIDSLKDSARTFKLTTKLIPKKKMKAQSKMYEKISQVMLNDQSSSDDLISSLGYNNKLIQIAYPNYTLTEGEIQNLDSWIDLKIKESEDMINQFQSAGIDPEVAQKHFLAMYLKELFQTQGETPKTIREIDLEEQEGKPQDKKGLFEPLTYAKSENNPLKSSFNNPTSPFQNPDFKKYFNDLEAAKNIEGSEDTDEINMDPESREKVAYSNWYAGNVDPEELHRHKELLDRQYFGGPIWDGVEKPKSIMNDPEQFKGYMETLLSSEQEFEVRNTGNDTKKGKNEAGEDMGAKEWQEVRR